MPFRFRTTFFVIFVALCALAVSAAPNLDVALSRQYQLVAERPLDAAVQNDLGNLLLLVDQDAAAEQAYRKALELDGSHRAARFNLGLLLQSRGEHSAAIDEFSALLEIDPRHAWANYQIGVSLQETGRRRAAADHYAKAFGLDPSLSFAENNPHVIDNTMMTEALLLSSRHGSPPGRTVARQYDDAERIALLMLEAERQAAAVASAGSAAPATGGEAVASEAAAEDGMRQGGSGLDARLDPAAGEGLPVEAAEEELEDGEDSGRRVITEKDLSGVQVGGAVGGPTASSPQRQGATSRGIDLRQSTRRGRDGRVVNRDQAPRSDLGTQRYRPARRSSASLDLELLPSKSSREGLG